MITERDVWKRSDKVYYRTCETCGTQFIVTNSGSNAKYCPKCLNKARRKITVCNVTDKEFEEIVDFWDTFIKNYCHTRLCIDGILFDVVYEQTLVNILYQCIYRKQRDMSLLFAKPIIVICIRSAFKECIFRRDLPPLFCNARKTTDDFISAERSLDTEVNEKWADEDLKLIDIIPDTKAAIAKLMDLKSLTSRIMVECVVDKDIRCAVVREEISDMPHQTNTEERLEILKEEYGIEVKDRNEFATSSRRGLAKLINAYGEEAYELLNLDKSERRTVACDDTVKYRGDAAIRYCENCGKAFIPERRDQIYCSRRCQVVVAERRRLERQEKAEIEAILSQVKTDNKELREKITKALNSKLLN